MTHRIEHLFHEPLFNLTQRDEVFFQYDSKNWFLFNDSKSWTPFWLWDKELNLFLSLTQRIVFFFKKKKRLKELNLLLYMTQRIELFFSIWLEDFSPKKRFIELNFFLNMTQRVEPFFWIWLKGLFFFIYDAKNWTLLWIWRKELNSFSLSMTQRIEPFFEYDAKNWTLFLWVWLKELNLFFDLFFSIWLKVFDLFFFSEYDFFFENWTFFWIRFTELNLFFPLFNMTQWDEVFFQCWLKELNPLFSQNVSKNWTSLSYEFFFLHDSKNWIFFEYDSKNWTFSFWKRMTQRIEPFFEHNSMNWTFFEHGSMNWTFF